VNWAASTFFSGTPVAAYVIKRYPASGGAGVVAGGTCAGSVAGTSCTDSSIPTGTYQYTVTPKQGPWLGAESAKSGAVEVR
jgi:hypothetical protein